MPWIRVLPHPDICPEGAKVEAPSGESICRALLDHGVEIEHACELLLRASRPSLAEAAVHAGYYDQSHLTREWAELAGCAPTAWLAEELHDPARMDEEFPFVQDAELLAG